MSNLEPGFLVSLLAGAAAGMSVDMTLFPIDTIKTRLQSAQGFWKTGGLKGIYRGVASAAVGSAPNAALFFVTYDTAKTWMSPHISGTYAAYGHMAAACLGEVVACTVRVPVEVVKQRAQSSLQYSSREMFQKTLHSEGILGLYRGWFSTVMREIPFALIQYPLWEYLKKVWSTYQGHYVDSWQAAICGAFAGGVAAGITTPMDVAKTRIMLADKDNPLAKESIINVLRLVYAQKKFRGLFAGVVPRVAWISCGGAVFFGAYEKSRNLLESITKFSSSV